MSSTATVFGVVTTPLRDDDDGSIHFGRKLHDINIRVSRMVFLRGIKGEPHIYQNDLDELRRNLV